MDPTDTSPERRLAAIMFADMVGYTALMQEDEARAHRNRDRHRAVLVEAVERHDGEVLQYYGDGSLSTFNSAFEAVQCAIEIQQKLQEGSPVPLRIGVHTGDIVFDGDGVYGDGVNVASRIEGLSAPGGILVSDKVFDDVKNHPEIATEPMGAVRLKNVKRPIEVFAISNPGLAVPTVAEVRARAHPHGVSGSAEGVQGGPAGEKARGALWRRPNLVVAMVLGLALATWALWRAIDGPGVPASGRGKSGDLTSIAVLPFVNASTDAEDAAFFADGIQDDVLTQLTKVGDLAVIARTSVMQYAGTTMTIPEIASELGVATVLEGRVQRAGDRLRINVQLIDAERGTHLWAEIYDRELTAENVFAIQSEIASQIAVALRGELDPSEQERIDLAPTENLEAYEAFLRADAYYSRPGWEASDLRDALQLYERAVALDPGFARAYASASLVHNDLYGWAYDRSAARLELARSNAEKALELAPDSHQGHYALGRYYLSTLELDLALQELAIAERGMPGSVWVPSARAQVLQRQGRWTEAIVDQRRAVSLDPRNPVPLFELAYSHLNLRQYDEGDRHLTRTLSLEPTFFEAALNKAAIPIWRDRDSGPMRAFLAGMPIGADPMGLSDVFLHWWVEILDGDYRAASTVLDGAGGEIIDFSSFFYPMPLLRGWTYAGLGQVDRATASFDSALVILQGQLAARDSDARVHSAMGLTLAQLGRRDEAVREGERAVALLPVSQDAMDGPYFVHELARIHAILGEGLPAARYVESFLTTPNPWSARLVLPDPVWDGVRSEPAFRELEERFGTAGPATTAGVRSPSRFTRRFLAGPGQLSPRGRESGHPL